MPEGLRLALTTFTIWPSRPARIDRETAGSAMLWCPFVGISLAIVAGIVLEIKRIVPTPLACVLAVIALALLTRGLHLDGLADTVDGLASRKPAPQALDIMSEGPIGALGAAALAFCLLVDVLALDAGAAAGRGFETLLVSIVTGRVAMVWACVPGVPAARPDGMGALVARTVPRGAAASWTVALGLSAFRFGSVRGVTAVFVALAVAFGVRVHAGRRLGGITGDVLGALCEIATAASLIVFASSLP
jgi:adenosylcobinamide-GDP ribazoletransferase